jgi:hypothetical protein
VADCPYEDKRFHDGDLKLKKNKKDKKEKEKKAKKSFTFNKKKKGGGYVVTWYSDNSDSDDDGSSSDDERTSDREGKRRHEAGRERGSGGDEAAEEVEQLWFNLFFLFCYYRLYFDGGGWSTRACVREAEAKARDFGIGWREIVCQNLLDSVFEYAISIFFV